MAKEIKASIAFTVGGHTITADKSIPLPFTPLEVELLSVLEAVTGTAITATADVQVVDA